MRPSPPSIPASFPAANQPVAFSAPLERSGQNASGKTLPNESRLLLQYFRLLSNSKLALISLTIAGLVTGIALTKIRTPIYQAHASLEIQGLNGDFLNIKNFDPTTAFQEYSPEGYILTQAKIIESESLLGRVAATLQSSGAIGGSAANSQLEYITDHLQVRLINGTHILELLCDSPDNRLAATFANAWAAEYIAYNLNSRLQVTQQTEDSLRAQLGEVKARLEKAEEDLLRYARASNLMFTGEKQNSVAEDKLRQVQQALSDAENERALKQSQFELSTSVPSEALPDSMDTGSSRRQNELKLLELRQELADLRTYMTPAHAKVQRVEAQIAELESALKKANARVVARIGSDYQAVQRRENLIRSNFEAQSKLVADNNEKAIRYSILKRDVDTNRALHESLLQKVKEAGVAKAMRANNIRLVDPAKVPGKPYKPNILRNSLVGLMGGLFVAIAFVIVRQRADHNIRVPGDAYFCINAPELGAIPSGEANSMFSRKLIADAHPRRQLAGPPPSADNQQQSDQLVLGGWGQSSSLIADSFRATLASLLLAPENSDRIHALVVTSAGPSEGKSTVVTNLGLALAETHRRVLLIDGDMRKPRLHEIFGIPNEYGLTDLLLGHEMNGNGKGPGLTRVAATSDLYVLPAGSGAGNISNLLYSARLPKLLQRFRDEFDAILIDTSPMIQTPDARVLARIAGGVILVIRAGHTSRDTAVAASKRFADDGTALIGTILTDWDLKGASGPDYKKYYNVTPDHLRSNGSH